MSLVMANRPSAVVTKFIGMLPISWRGWSRGEINLPVTSGSACFVATAGSFAVAADSIGLAQPSQNATKPTKAPIAEMDG